MSSALYFANPSDVVDFGSIDISGGSGLTAFSIHVRVKFDPGSLVRTGIWLSQWGSSSGNGLGWMLGVENGHGSQNVFWFQGGGIGNYDGTGSTGNALTADGVFRSLVVTWGPLVAQTQVWLEGTQLSANNSGFHVGGISRLSLNAANLLMGNSAAGTALPGSTFCDIGFWGSTGSSGNGLSQSDIQLLASGNPCSTVSLSTLLAFTDVADTKRLFRIGASIANGTPTGTTVVAGPTTLTPYSIQATPAANSVLVTTSVNISTTYGPYGVPTSPVTLTPVAVGGTISPTSGTVGTTFTFTAGNAVTPATVTFNNDGGFTPPVVNLTITVLPVELRSAQVMQSGQSICLQFERTSDHILSNLTALTTPPTIRVNGTPATLAPTIWLDPSLGALPYAIVQLAQPPAQTVVVNDKDAGFATTGAGWGVGIGQYYAYNPDQTQHFTDGPGDTASWTFTGLTPGARYRVGLNWISYNHIRIDRGVTQYTISTSHVAATVHDGATVGTTTLGTVAIDQRFGPQGMSTAGASWFVLGDFTVSGTTLTVGIANAAGSGRMWAGPALVQKLVTSVAIAPGDVVTLSAPVNWVSCTDGGVNPYVNFTVNNRAGHPLAGDFVAGPKTMPIGYNIEAMGGGCPYPLANFKYAMQVGWAFGATDSGGNLTAIVGGSAAAYAYFMVVYPNGVDRRNLASAPGVGGSGRWKLRYSIPPGSGSPGGNFLSIVNGETVGNTDGTVVTVAVAEHTATDGKREVEYDVLCDPNSNTPILAVYATDVPGTDIEIYGPSLADHNVALVPDPAHPWNPEMIAALTRDKVTSIRGLDFLALGNNNNGTTMADVTAVADNRRYFNEPVWFNLPDIASIASVDVTATDADTAIAHFNYTRMLKVTFVAPHGVTTGQQIYFKGMDLSHPAYGPSGALAGRTIRCAGGDPGFANGAVWTAVKDATTLLVNSFFCPGAAITMTPDLSIPASWPPGTVETPPGGQHWYAQGYHKYGAPPEMFIDFCNRIPNCTPWLNIPILFTDAAVADLVDLVLSMLAPGRKIRFEYSNEPWNPGNLQNFVCLFNAIYAASSGELPFASNSGPYWYGWRAARIFEVVRARAAVAGRSADVVCTMNVQQGNPGATTASSLDGYQAAGIGAPLDEISGATYLDSVQYGAPSAAAFTAMTDHQWLDVYEASTVLAVALGSDLVTYAHYGSLVAHGWTTLDGAGRYVTGTRFSNYEGGPQVMCFNGFGQPLNLTEISHRINFHPRHRDIALETFQRLQDEDTRTFTRFFYQGTAYYNSLDMWSTYPGYSLETGLGDGTDGKFNNLTNAEDPRAISTYGDAIKTWNALVVPPSPATGYTVAGPGFATVGAASADFTVTVNGSFTGTITATPSGCGLAYPIVRTYTDTDRPQTFPVTPVAPGTVTLTFTNDGGFTDPAPLTCVVTAPGSFHLDGPPSFSVTSYWTTYTRFQLNSILQNPATNPDGFLARLPLGGGRYVVCCSTPPGFTRAPVTDLTVPLGPGTVTAPGRYLNQRISGSPWPYGAPDTITINPIDGSWLGIGHVEQYPNGVSFVPPTYYSLYALMRSVDLGVTWNYCGVVVSPQITQADTFANSLAVNVGIGSLAVVGPWLYTHFCEYKTAWSGYSNADNFGLGVARTDANAAFTAAINGTVTPWSKWDGTGWSEAGLGGLGAYVVPTVAYPIPGNGVYGTEFFTFYHRGLGKYVGTNGAAGQPSGNQIKILFSDDLIHWSDPVLLPTTEPATDNYQYVTFWPTDPTGDDGISGDGSLLLTYLAYGTDFGQATLRQRTITFDGLSPSPPPVSPPPPPVSPPPPPPVSSLLILGYLEG